MNEYKFIDLYLGLNKAFNSSITDQMMDQFLCLSGDNNPIHVHEDYALSRGFANKVVYGLLTSALYSQLIGVHLPGKFCLLHRIDIKFTKPVYVGDLLKVYGEITHLNEAYKQAEIKAHICKQDGQFVSRSKIYVGLIDA